MGHFLTFITTLVLVLQLKQYVHGDLQKSKFNLILLQQRIFISLSSKILFYFRREYCIFIPVDKNRMRMIKFETLYTTFIRENNYFNTIL